PVSAACRMPPPAGSVKSRLICGSLSRKAILDPGFHSRDKTHGCHGFYAEERCGAGLPLRHRGRAYVNARRARRKSALLQAAEGDKLQLQVILDAVFRAFVPD